MILPDINLLVYAHNVRAPLHDQALAWFNECLAGSRSVALPWGVLLGFVRITTHPSVFPNPLTPAAALSRVEEWLSLPHFSVVHPGTAHFQILKKLLSAAGTAGNLTTDAHLAALAIERALVLHTNDADFSRFAGLKWVNPLAGR